LRGECFLGTRWHGSISLVGGPASTLTDIRYQSGLDVERLSGFIFKYSASVQFIASVEVMAVQPTGNDRDQQSKKKPNHLTLPVKHQFGSEVRITCDGLRRGSSYFMMW